ncbi:RNase H domain-containing protein [Trichonephila clavipes]|nr:RNase H domain-containing protein [Trichonephila clavipes]
MRSLLSALAPPLKRLIHPQILMRCAPPSLTKWIAERFLEKLKRLSPSLKIHLHWVLLHVNIVVNEIADTLAKDGAAQPSMNSALLTYSELYSTYINNKQSTVPPAHHWYEAKRPGGYLSLQCSRQERTILTHFWSG